MKKSLKVGIIGAGLIGQKRAEAILELGEDQVVAVADIDLAKAEVLASKVSAQAFAGWQEILSGNMVDAVVVATTTDVNVKITLAALKAGKHVLAEKPLGANVQEAKKLLQAAKISKGNLKVGYNHRHHPSLSLAHKFLKAGKIGDIMYIRSVYGHGARPGYDTEWRMQKKYSVGGELYDQGVHIIDLCNWFLGGFTRVFGQVRNFYWKKSDLEDNAFCQLFTKKGPLASFQVSLTQWKNRFLFEIYGTKGYLSINGKGKSYGIETLTLGTQVGLGKTPEEEVFTFEGPDVSWKEEWKEFKSSILQKRLPMANAKDNLVLNKILQGLYASAKGSKIVKI